MGKTALKWLAATGTGVAVAILSVISAAVGNLDLGDPWVTGIAAGAIAKIVGWLTSQLPAAPVSDAE